MFLTSACYPIGLLVYQLDLMSLFLPDTRSPPYPCILPAADRDLTFSFLYLLAFESAADDSDVRVINIQLKPQ
jgi:hypothetical protein